MPLLPSPPTSSTPTTSTASPSSPSFINSTDTSPFTTIYLFAMANIPTLLYALLAAFGTFSLLSLALLLVIAILITLIFSIVALRLTPSIRQDAELAHENVTLQCQFDAGKKALSKLVDSDRVSLLDTKDPSGRPPAPVVDPEMESERVQALEARLDFLRDSCQVMMARKTDMLAEKDDLLARKNMDLATLKAQLDATHQTKNELLAEKDARYTAVLTQKADELAALKAQLTAAQQTITIATTERDEAVARVDAVADGHEKTRADYDDKIASLTNRAVDAESRVASLQIKVQHQETDIGDILLKNNNLSLEIALLTKRLETASRQRTTPSPRYSFQSFMYPRNSESESDSSFNSDKPSPSRWRRFTIRRARKSGKP